MVISMGDIGLLFKAKDEASAMVEVLRMKLKNLEEQSTRTSYQLALLGRGARELGGLLTASLTVPIVAASAASLKFGASFETSMTRIITLAGSTRTEVDSLRQKVIDLGVSSSVGPNELAKGLFVLESYGLRGAAAMETLRVASQMTALGMGDAEQSARALTGAIFAYRSQNLSAAEAGDILLRTVALGNMKIDELTPALATINPLAAAMGIKFQDVAAALATFTHAGVNSAVASTSIRAILNNILQDSVKTEKGFAALAKATGDSTITMKNFRQEISEKGLTVAMLGLAQAVNKAGEAGMDAFADIIPNIRGLVGALGVYKENGEMVTDILDKMSDEHISLANSTKELEKTWAYQWNQIKAATEEVWILLSDSLIPVMKEFGAVLKETVVPMLREMAMTFNNLPAPVKDASMVMVGLLAVVGPLLIYFGTLAQSIGNLGRGWETLTKLFVRFGITGEAVSGFFAGLGPAIIEFLSGPLGWAVLAFTTLVGLLYYFEGMGGVIGFFKGLWAIVSDLAIILTKVVLFLGEFILKASGVWYVVKAFKDMGVWIWEKIAPGLAWLLEKTEDWGSYLIGILDRMAGKVRNMPSLPKSPFDTSSTAIPGSPIIPSVNSSGGGFVQGTGIEDAAKKTNKLLEAVKALSVAQIEAIMHDKELGLTIQQTAAAEGIAAEVIGVTIRQQIARGKTEEQLAKELKKTAEARAILRDLEGDQLVNGALITEDLKNQILYWHLLGASNAEIINADIARKGVVQQVTAAYESQKDKQKELYDASVQAHEEWRKMEEKKSQIVADSNRAIYESDRELAKFRREQSGTLVEAQLGDIQDWVDAQILGTKAVGDDLVKFTNNVATIAQTRRDNLFKDNEALKVNSQESLLAIASKARATYLEMEKDPKKYNQATRQHFKEIAQEAENTARGIKQTLGQAFQDLLKNIPGTVASALQGGGGLSGAIKSIGSQAGSLLGKSLFSETSKFLGPMAAAIGSFAGPVLEGVYNVFAKTEEKLVNKTRQALVDSYDTIGAAGTGLANFAQKAAEAGMTLNNLLNARTPEAYEAALKLLNQAMDTHNKLLETQKKLTEATTALAVKQVSNANAVIAYISSETDAWFELAKSIQEAKSKGEDFSKLVDQQKNLIKFTSQELENLGVLAVASFGGAIANGKSFAEAIALASPGLNTLSRAFEALGISSDNAFLKTLMSQSKMLKNNPDLVNGISALGQSFAGLSALGLLNVDTFRSMEQTGAAMYTRLQAEAAAAGGETRDALLPMQGFLHDAEEAAKKLGIPLDENTKKLIEQSKELGIWKDKGKSDTDVMIEAMSALVREVKALVDTLARIQDVNFNVTGTYNAPDLPDPNSGYIPKNAIPNALGGDYMVTKPTLFLAGEAGPERATFTPQGKPSSYGHGSELHAEVIALRNDLNASNRRLPYLLSVAVKDMIAQTR